MMLGYKQLCGIDEVSEVQSKLVFWGNGLEAATLDAVTLERVEDLY
jgi:hypothetical protein